MYSTAAISLVNWFRAGRPLHVLLSIECIECRGRRNLGFRGVQSLFTGMNRGCDDDVEHRNQWKIRHTNFNVAASCISPLSAIHLLAIAPMSPNKNQTKKFYVVRKGKIPGIYDTWGECKRQVQGFPGNEYKGFLSRKEAKNSLFANGMKGITHCLDAKDSVKDLHGTQPSCVSEDLLKACLPMEELDEKRSNPRRLRKKLDISISKEASFATEEPLKKSNKSRRSRMKSEAIDSKKDIREMSSLLETSPKKSFNSKKSKKKHGEAISNEDLVQASFAIEEPLKKSVKSRRSERKFDAIDSMQDMFEISSSLEVCPEKSSNSRTSKRKHGEAISNEDIGQTSFAIEEPLKKSFKSRRLRKKFDAIDSKQDLLEIASLSEASLGKSSNPRKSKKKHGGATSNEDILNISSLLKAPPEKSSRSRKSKKNEAVSNEALYWLEFDGASKGNPGKSGAGAVLRNQDGSVVCKLKEGVGVATNNVAEYRAVIRGLKVALSKGITRIQVQGDSKLVCMQIQDIWQTKNENIAYLSKEAKELKSKFKSFHITHVERAFNSEADALANAAVELQDGEWISTKAGTKGHGLENS